MKDPFHRMLCFPPTIMATATTCCHLDQGNTKVALGMLLSSWWCCVQPTTFQLQNQLPSPELKTCFFILETRVRFVRMVMFQDALLWNCSQEGTGETCRCSFSFSAFLRFFRSKANCRSNIRFNSAVLLECCTLEEGVAGSSKPRKRWSTTFYFHFMHSQLCALRI